MSVNLPVRFLLYKYSFFLLNYTFIWIYYSILFFSIVCGCEFTSLVSVVQVYSFFVVVFVIIFYIYF